MDGTSEVRPFLLPSGFRGVFLTRSEQLLRYASSSGPVVQVPTAVAVPADIGDVAALVRWAAAEGRCLVPRSAATGMPGGNVGRHVVVDLKTAFGIVDAPDPRTNTIRVGAGAIAGDVARAAERVGLFLPPLPSSADRCTIGGMVANNAAGPRTLKYGAVRDWVHGMTFVAADGRVVALERGGPLDALGISLPWPSEQILEGWPDVRKNSSGYALRRFHEHADPIDLLVGSEGTLGLVTDVTLRLAPLPEQRRIVLVACPHLGDVVAWARFAAQVGASACEFMARSILEMAGLDEDSELGPLTTGRAALVLIELDGDPAAVASGVAQVEDRARSIGASFITQTREEEAAAMWALRRRASPVIERAQAEGVRSMQFIEDCVVPVDRLDVFLDRLEGILDEAETAAVIFGHAGDGNPHVNPLVDVRRPDWRRRVRSILYRTAALVAELGGTLAGEHGDGRVRAPLLETIWGPSRVRAFKELKYAFDPDGILNPGTILPTPSQDPLDGFGEPVAPVEPPVAHPA